MQSGDSQSEVEKLLDVLRSFPPEQQEALAAYYRAEAEQIRDVEARLADLSPQQLARLRRGLREGMNSGAAREVDFEEIKRRGRARLDAEGRL